MKFQEFQIFFKEGNGEVEWALFTAENESQARKEFERFNPNVPIIKVVTEE